MLVDHLHDIIAYARQLRFNLLPILVDPLHVVLVPLRLLLLLDRGEDPPRCPPRADHVLVSDREEISLLDCQFDVQVRDFLHGIDHFCKEEKRNDSKCIKTLKALTLGLDRMEKREIVTVVALCLLCELCDVDEVVAFFGKLHGGSEIRVFGWVLFLLLV